MALRDLSLAARTLRKSPVFTATAVITLALGIGASTAIFSVTNGVLLRPLPYKNPSRLVVATVELRKRNVKDWLFSNADFLDFRNGTKPVFEEVSGVITGRGPLPARDGTPEQVRFALVTTNFFHTLGARILIGRDFNQEDGQPQPAPPQTGNTLGAPSPRLPTFAVLSYEYFERRYGGDTSIIGRPIQTQGGSGPVVVGVLEPGFELSFPPNANIDARPDIWTAARIPYDNATRNTATFYIVARLKNGVSVERGRTQAEAVAAGLRRAFAIDQTADYRIDIAPMDEYLVSGVRPAILALMGAVIFLLLIACSNVANLMLVRMSMRQQELAIRVSLGGSWWQLVRQMLVESLLVASLGTICGLALASFGIHELLVIAPANLPRLDAIGLDARVLLFTVVVGFGSVALFGLVPAIRAARPNVMSVLRGSSRTSGLAGGGLLRSGVVIAEVALCFILLIGSGLMIRSFIALQHIDPGFDAQNLLTFRLLGPLGATPDQRAAAMRQIRQELGAIPGVRSVAASAPFPLMGGFYPIRWGTAEALGDNSKFQAVDNQIVLPGYFEALRTPLLAGRTFTEADNAANRNVVVVDQKLAQKAFPSENAIGKRILIRIRTPEPEWVEIIGVVAHQRDVSLAEPGREQLYFTDAFVGSGRANVWAIRTSGDPSRYAEQVRKTMRAINSHLLVTETLPMQEYVQRARAGTRFSLLLIGTFAVISALLAAVGLYGVLSTIVRQRTAEIGVRMAIGAAPNSIFSLIVGSGLRLTVAGIVAGIVAALALTRLMTSMLVNIKPSDPTTFVSMAALFMAIAFLASWLPARRASKLDPTAALRES
jgi:putative ABC transport system permease protein